MRVPGIPAKSPARSSSDSDAELLWPPPEEARFAIDVMDLQTHRVMTVHEAATQMAASTSIVDEVPKTGIAPPHDVTAVAAPSGLVAQPFERERLDEMIRRRHANPRFRRFSTRVLMRALVAIVLLQAIAIAAFLMRGGSPRLPLPATNRAAPVEIRTSPEQAPAVDPPRAASADTPSGPARIADGRLLVRSEPPGATVAIDGRRRGMAPLTIDDLAAGSHRVQLGTSGASIEQVVMIEAGATTSLVVPLQNAAATSSGWLNVTTPIELHLTENGRQLGTSADGPLRLATGSHQLQLVNESLGYRGVESVTIRAGEIARLRPSLPDGVLHVNAQPWANVWLDGAQIGETPLANIKVALGQHEIRFTHPSFGEQVRQVVVSAAQPSRVSVNMKP